LSGEKPDLTEIQANASGQFRPHPGTIALQRIVLTGFMGSGKSTVGRLLARQLRWRFADADGEIEKATNASIAEIFRDQGEPWFRELEHRTIDRLLKSEQIILALGGGAIEDQRTRHLLLNEEGTRLIHLETSFETVLKRCTGTEAFRPVLADRANLRARFERRLPLYRQAHLNITVDAMTPFAVIQTVMSSLGIVPE
jgi:shikimate kinase